MKKFISILLVLSMVLGMSTSVFAGTEENPSSSLGNVIKTGAEEMSAVIGDPDEPQTGRHYTVKEEVVADRRSNEYVYPTGKNSKTALKRAYVYSEKHYKVYRKRVGNDTYKAFLYDEYHTTWHGEERSSTDAKWNTVVAKKSEVAKERSPIVALLGILM